MKRKALHFFTITFMLVCFFSTTVIGQWTAVDSPFGIVQTYATASDDKLYLPGGVTWTDLLDEVQVYDIANNLWTTMPLSSTKAKIASVVNGDFLFCAGGVNFNGFEIYNTVDIFDLTSHTLLRTDTLTLPRIESSAVAVGNKVLIAGGFYSATPPDFTTYSTVDIYDMYTETWTVADLSEPRAGMASAVLNNKAYFAGGYKGNGEVSDKVDIYDFDTDSWSTITLPVARAFYGGGVVFNDKIWFAGGIMANDSSTTQIDIYDPQDQSWSKEHLSTPRFGVQAAATHNHATFSGGGMGILDEWIYNTSSNVVDVYSNIEEEWSVHNMNDQRINHSSLSVNNQVFIVGGFSFDTEDFMSEIEVFTDVTTSIFNPTDLDYQLKVFPNPGSEQLNLISEVPRRNTEIRIINALGQLQMRFDLDGTGQLDISQLDPGVYFILEYSTNGLKLFSNNKFVKVN